MLACLPGTSMLRLYNISTEFACQINPTYNKSLETAIITNDFTSIVLCRVVAPCYGVVYNKALQLHTTKV